MAKIKQFDLATLGITGNVEQRVPIVHTDDIDVPSMAKLKATVTSDKTVTLDHQKAIAYLDLPIFPGEREVADSSVQLLYDEMRKGTFNSLLVILSSAVLSGVRYKINGQHTCWAVLAMPPSFSLQVREIEYRTTNDEQLKLLYSTYDRLRARSDTHITKIFLAGTPLTEGLWMSEIPRLVSALGLWNLNDNQRRRVSPEQMITAIQRDHSEVFRRVALYRQNNFQAPPVKRQPVIAAMFATFEKLPTKAEEFWQPVLDGTHLSSKMDPRWQLRDLLNSTSIRGSQSTARAGRIMSAEDLYRTCLLAWNKWRKDEPVRVSLRVPAERLKLL